MRRTKRSRAYESLEIRNLLAADVSIFFEPVPESVRTTEAVSYVVRVKNHGPDDVSNALVQIDDPKLEAVEWNRQGPFDFPPEVALNHLDGTNGVSFEDIGMSTIGDINGDELQDFIVYGKEDSTYVVFGTPGFVDAPFESPQTLDGTNGFLLEAFDRSSRGTPAGDVNGDGIGDLLFGSHVVFGATDIGASGKVRSTGAWRITSASKCDECRGTWGMHHAAAGDVNGDGFDDLLFSDSGSPREPVFSRGEIISYRTSDIGSVWIIFGSADSTRRPVELSSLDGVEGFQIRPDTQQDWEFGSEAFGMGDYNQDGFDDLIIVDSYRRVGGHHENTVYLIAGSKEIGGSGEILIDPILGAEGVTRFVHRDSNQSDWFSIYNVGYSEQLADVNNDGFQDFLLDNIVMHGSPTGFAFENAQPDGFGVIDIATLEGVEAFLPWNGWWLEFGDLNHDGHDDLVLGDTRDLLFNDGIENNGAVYVFFGDGDEDPFDFNVASLDGNTGFRALGTEPFEYLGISVDFIGDVNSDGIDDLLIAERRGVNVNVIFGSESFSSIRSGSISDRVDIPANGEVTYTLTGTVPAQATGAIQATAIVWVGDDLDAANNGATSSEISVVNAAQAATVDLAIQVENSHDIVFPGEEPTYIVSVSNAGDTYASAARLNVELDPSIEESSWTRLDTGEQGTGNIEQTINLSPGQKIDYEVSPTIGRKIGEITTVATIEASEDQTEVQPDNNTATSVSQAPLRPQFPNYLGAARPCFEDSTVANGRLFFVGWRNDECFISRSQASSGFYGGHLWSTDGTRAGTRRMRQFHPEPLDFATPIDGLWDSDLTEFQGIAYFAADDVSTGQELWRSDGTQDGTFVVKDIASEWREEVGHFGTTRNVNPSAEIDNLGATSKYLLFSANDEIHGRELWRTDGTEEGTTLVKDIHPGDGHGFERDAYTVEADRSIVYNDIYYFIADDGTHGLELWRSDGTADGTYMLKDIAAGSDSAFTPRGGRWWEAGTTQDPRLQVHNGLLYFYENSAVARGTLWQTDGTSEGTVPARDTNLPPSDRLIVGDKVITFSRSNFYRSNLDGTNRELIAKWYDDKEFRPTWMRALGDQVVFSINQSNSYMEGQSFVFDTRVDQVEITASPEIDLTGRVHTLHAATDLLSFNRLSDSTWEEDWLRSVEFERGYSSSVREDFTMAIVSPTDVLGRTSNDISLRSGESIVLGFPGSIIDGSGDDIRIATPWPNGASILVDGIDADGQFHHLGTLGSESGIDLAKLGRDIPPLTSLKLTAAERPLWDYPFYLRYVMANTDAEAVVTASSAVRPDLEFSWDLDNDGVFDDATGRSIGLRSDELAQLGITEPGEYPIRVRMNDREQDYFDEAILHITGLADTEPNDANDPDISLADINNDGSLTFADFLILSQNYEKTDASKAEGDLDGDGIVSFADFLMLSHAFRLNTD